MTPDGENEYREEGGQELHKAYRKMLREEIDWPEVRREKKQFIQENFDSAGFHLKPGHVLVPLFAAALAVAAGLLLFPEKVHTPARDPWTQSILRQDPGPVVSAPALPPEPSRPPVPPRSVMVESLSSDLGTPMVFHQNQENVSLVVIWIFPSGKG